MQFSLFHLSELTFVVLSYGGEICMNTKIKSWWNLVLIFVRKAFCACKPELISSQMIWQLYLLLCLGQLHDTSTTMSILNHMKMNHTCDVQHYSHGICKNCTNQYYTTLFAQKTISSLNCYRLIICMLTNTHSYPIIYQHQPDPHALTAHPILCHDVNLCGLLYLMAEITVCRSLCKVE